MNIPFKVKSTFFLDELLHPVKIKIAAIANFFILF